MLYDYRGGGVCLVKGGRRAADGTPENRRLSRSAGLCGLLPDGFAAAVFRLAGPTG